MFHKKGKNEMVSQLSTEVRGLGYCVTRWDGVQ